MKYEIKFKHIVEESYTAIVEADNKDLATEIFNADPFGFVEGNGEPEDVQGLEIEIDEINKI